MLKRIYIDNFRCLVNFELKFDSLHVFLGSNGTGKSSVFEVLRKLNTFIINGVSVNNLFNISDCTIWQTSSIQTFELEFENNQGMYKYELAIKHDHLRKVSVVIHERLFYNQKVLVDFSHGMAKLYNYESLVSSDQDSLEYQFPFHGRKKSIFLMVDEVNNPIVNCFYQQIKKLIIIKIFPPLLVDYSDQEDLDDTLVEFAGNYVSWYRYISQNQRKTFELINVLKKVFENFSHFKFEPSRELRQVLKICFSGESKDLEYKMSQLSDGQKALIVLYTLITCLKGEDYTLCIDEPENFLALAEIQPWLMKLYDLCSENQLQAFLISHHPEMINFDSSVGYWFERRNNYTSVRVKLLSEKLQEKNFEDPSLSISEMIAKGGIDD